MVGRAAEAITEQIRQASDIADVVGAFVQLKRAGKDLKGLCPFHREKTPSFHVVPSKQIFHCFGCGVGGDVFKFIQLRESVAFPEARAILAARAGISLEARDRAPDAGKPGKAEFERVNRWACEWFQEELAGPAGRNAREYAAHRGVSDQSIQTFAIGFAPESWDALTSAAARRGIGADLLVETGLAKRHPEGRVYDAFRNRLMFPIRDVMNRTLGFGGRALGDDRAKYLNTAQNALFDKRRCLYGIATARDAVSHRGTAVVVEGYLDCVIAHQHGFPHTVATLGTALTPEHVDMIRRYAESVVLVFDSDEAGVRAADRAIEIVLAGRLDVRLARVPEGKDPAEYLLSAQSGAFDAVLTSAVPALEYKWRQLRRRIEGDGGDAGGRRAIEEFLQLVAGAEEFGSADLIQRGLVSNQLSKLLGLPREEVFRRLDRAGSAPPRGNVPPEQQDTAADSPPAETVADAASTATRELLEVLLNDPTYYDAVSAKFDPEWLPDEPSRRIGRVVAELAARGRGFSLAELMCRFDSVQIARRISDLQLRGERRGNYAATVEGAVTRLQTVRADRRAAEIVSELRAGEAARADLTNAPPPSPDSRDADRLDGDARMRLRGMQEIAGPAGRFAARRHLASVPRRHAPETDMGANTR